MIRHGRGCSLFAVVLAGLVSIAGIPAADAAPVKSRPGLREPREVATAAAKLDAVMLAGLTRAGQKPNGPASDEQFVRRVYLDIVGRIPTAPEATSFLTDKSPQKRAVLIDKLLGSDGYDSHMFNWLADTLRVKDVVGKAGLTFVYQEWLKEQIASDRAWDQIVYDMLTARGKLAESGPAGYLLRDPGMPLDSLSNTLTTFLGANVACAQCHDHPSAPWTQEDFYEMAAYFGGTETQSFKARRLARQVIRRSAAFEKTDKRFLAVMLEANAAAVRDVPNKRLRFPDDYKYGDSQRGAPVQPALIEWSPTDKASPAYLAAASLSETPREAFATWLTHPENPRFAAAIANRVLKKSFGIAAVEPVTDLDDLGAADNSELLNHLASEMKRVEFSLREFQRILFNSQAYQRQSSLTPDLANGSYRFAGPVVRRMSAEQVWDSVLTLAAGDTIDHFKLHRAQVLKKFVIPEEVITPRVAEAAALRLQEAGQTRLRPRLLYDVVGDGPAPPRIRGFMIARASELQQPAKESHFLRVFGQSDRTVADDSSLEGGIPQVLIQMNGDVQEIIRSRDGVLFSALEQLKTPEEKINLLYVSFLSRRPNARQAATARKALAEGATMSDLTWVLLNTREFIFIQ